MEHKASLDLALVHEATERNFYLTQAARSRNKLAKAMFTTLAKDEEDHMARIQGLYQELQNQSTWSRASPAKVINSEARQVLDNMAGTYQSTKDFDEDDIRALTRAIEFEAYGARLYAQLAEEGADVTEKNFFEFLAKVEREHLESLADTLAYLNDPVNWFMEHEHSMLDGA